MRVRIRAGLVCGSAALLLAVAARSPARRGSRSRTFSWSIEAGAERTDNIGRTATNDAIETIGIVGLGPGHRYASGRACTPNIAADLEYRDISTTRSRARSPAAWMRSWRFRADPGALHLGARRQLRTDLQQSPGCRHARQPRAVQLPVDRARHHAAARHAHAAAGLRALVRYLPRRGRRGQQRLIGNVGAGRMLSEHAYRVAQWLLVADRVRRSELFADYETRAAFLRLDREGAAPRCR